MSDINKLIFNRFQIIEEIDRGAMGAVFRAVDINLDRPVAIKKMFINRNLNVEVQNEQLRRFTNEAKAIAKLSHPNIVTVYEAGEFEGEHFIVMEYLEGISLSKYMEQRQGIEIENSINIIINAANALGFAHSKNLIHRDVKPGNIMVLDNGTVKIMDFGIAKEVGGSHLTATDMAVGTIGYMSPEQCDSDKTIDGRSDIFSLSVILYQLITGQKPFPGDTFVSFVGKLVNTSFSPAPVKSYNPDIPDSLEAIISKGLARDRNMRYQNTNDLITDLQSVISELKTGKKVTIVTPVVPPVAPSIALVSPTVAIQEETRRTETTQMKKIQSPKEQKKIYTAMTAVLLFILAGVILFFYKDLIFPKKTSEIPLPPPAPVASPIPAKQGMLIINTDLSNLKLRIYTKNNYPLLSFGEIRDWNKVIAGLKDHTSPEMSKLWDLLDDETRKVISSMEISGTFDDKIKQIIIRGLNKVLENKDLYSEISILKNVRLIDEADEMKMQMSVKPGKDKGIILNRLVLVSLFPNEILKEPVFDKMLVNEDGIKPGKYEISALNPDSSDGKEINPRSSPDKDTSAKMIEQGYRLVACNSTNGNSSIPSPSPKSSATGGVDIMLDEGEYSMEISLPSHLSNKFENVNYKNTEIIINADQEKVIEPKISLVKKLHFAKEQNDPLRCSLHFYECVAKRNFKDAYRLKSNRYRMRYDYDSWYRDVWSNNVSLAVLKSELTRKTDNSADVALKLYSEDVNRISGNKEEDTWNGTIYLVKDKGVWWIDSVSFQSEKRDKERRANQMDPVSCVTYYYNSINNKEFQNAYDVESMRARRETSYDRWYNNIWYNNVAITIMEKRLVENRGSSAEVVVLLNSIDINGGIREEKQFIGLVEVIYEQGLWVIDRFHIISREEYERRSRERQNNN